MSVHLWGTSNAYQQHMFYVQKKNINEQKNYLIWSYDLWIIKLLQILSHMVSITLIKKYYHTMVNNMSTKFY